MAEDKVIITLVDRVSSALRSIDSNVQKFNGGIGRAAAGAAKFGAAIGAAGTVMAGKFVKDGIDAAVNIEQLSTSFEVMLGSADAAQKMMADVTAFAASTPFELPGIQTASKSLLAFGIEQEKIIPSLKMVGDVAAGVGAPLEDLAVIYGKARTAGTLYAEDVNQLTERGIPIIAELAKQFGVAESEVKGLVEDGKVGFDDLEKAFQNMTGEGGQFFNLMEKQSKTAGGVISNLKDTFFQLGLALVGVDPTGVIKPGGLFDQFKVILGNVTTFLSDNKQTIMDVAGAIGGALVTALFAVGNAAVTGFGVIQSVIGYLAEHQGLLMVVAGAIAGPLVFAFSAWAVSAAIAAASTLLAMAPFIILGAVIFGLAFLIIKNWDKIKAATIAVWGAIKGFFVSWFNSIKNLFTSSWNRLVALTTAVWNGIKSLTSAVWNGIKGFFVNWFNSIRSTFSNAWNNLKNLLSNVLDAMR